ncbi:hypothetical protein NHF46_25070 [Arthrobacter alpinus]|nr:hypothetical protein [Arthrobacter alpinus]
MQAWLDLLDDSLQGDGAAVTSSAASGAGAAAAAAGLRSWVHPEWVDLNSAGLGLGAVSKVRVVGTEQSNTSVIFELDGRPVIAKIFRVLHPGDHRAGNWRGSCCPVWWSPCSPGACVATGCENQTERHHVVRGP